jgi:hypothetical protein
MNTEKTELLKKYAAKIGGQVTELCEMENGPFVEGKRNRWSPMAGQLLVYGLERQLGFAKAAELEATVEGVWKKGKAIVPVIEEYFLSFVK